MKKNYKLSPKEKGALFLLALFVLFCIPSWYTHWQMNRGIASFQGQTTEFIINTSIPLPYVQLDSGQLTPEQLQLIQRYVDSYQFEKTVFLREFRVDGGPRWALDFDTPYGHLSLREDQVYWSSPLGITCAARFQVDEECSHQMVDLLKFLSEQQGGQQNEKR